MLDGRAKCKLREIIDIEHGFAFSSEFFASHGSHVLLTPGNFREEGGFRWLGEKQKFYTGPLPIEYVMSPGQMLIAMTEQAPGLLGSTIFVPEGRSYLHNQRLGLVRIKNSARVCALYLHYLFASTPIRKLISAESAGTKVKHTSPDKILALDVSLPPLPEQRKIAEILRTWDDAIEKVSRSLDQRRQNLTALRQKLLGIGGSFRPEHARRPLSDLSTRVRRQNGGGSHPVMTISAKSGFILQSDRYSREMAGTSLEKYIVLHKGEFAYNKGNSLTYPQGCIFSLDRPSALVPHVYFCFAMNPGLHRDFYAHVFEADLLNRQLHRVVNSGVRNDGLLNVNADDFFGCMLPVPEASEQKAVATVLNAAKREIGLIEREMETLIRQKRGLMQKLLTGEWRVTVESAP